MLKFHILYFYHVKNWHDSSQMLRIGTIFFTNVNNRYQVLTRVKNRYKSPTSVKNWYQIITCKKFKSKLTRVKNWDQILTHMKNWYQIITDVKNWYLIVTVVSDKQKCEELKLNTKCTRFVFLINGTNS